MTVEGITISQHDLCRIKFLPLLQTCPRQRGDDGTIGLIVLHRVFDLDNGFTKLLAMQPENGNGGLKEFVFSVVPAPAVPHGINFYSRQLVVMNFYNRPSSLKMDSLARAHRLQARKGPV